MDQEKIGKFIAELRKRKNLTQEELAEKLGVNSRTISRWENGNCMPDLSMFPLISKELDISINELMTGSNIEKEEYQDKFEENVVTTVSKVDRANKRSDIFINICVGLIALFALWFSAYVFCNAAQFTEHYKNLNITARVESKQIRINVDSYYSSKYVITSYKENNEKIGLIFITTKYTIANYFDRKNSLYNRVDLTYGDTYDMIINLENSKIPSKFRIYYTEVNFKKIYNADNSKLKEIIKKSNLVYEGNL